LSTSPAASAAVDETACEVFVIGGGPAGSTIGALLAGGGRRVVVADQDRHPRFHIGESLLPLNLPLFERLGVAEEVARIGMVKRGAEFCSKEHGRSITFDFCDALDNTWPHAYQVRRSELDHLLLRHCAARGAEVHEATRVTAVEFLAPGDIRIHASDESGVRRVWRAKFLVDASGRETFLASRLGIKRKNTRHNSAALYGHFTGARRMTGAAEGNITVFWFAHGWIWFIPLKDGTTSVGAVCWPSYLKTRKSDPTTFFLETLALCPELMDRLQDAQLITLATATGNYSYYAQRMTGNDFIMVGDAYGFIDPVFSSGVYLAMKGAFLGAEVVEGCLREPAAAPRLYRGFERTVRRGLTTFSWMIYRMTSPTMRDLIMNPSNVLGIQAAVISFLAGDVFKHGPVWQRLLLFRAVYYSKSLASLKTSFRAWRGRRATAGAIAS
jgi:flavin-dependent dehydrogenase